MDFDIDERISRGVLEKRIDAYIASEIHSITNKYDEHFIKVLNLMDFINDPSSTRDTNASTLSIHLNKLIQHILSDLWEQQDLDIVFKCIRALSYLLDCSHLENSYNAYAWDSYKLFKIISQPFAHSRTLMGITCSKILIQMFDPEINFEDYSLQFKKQQPMESDSTKTVDTDIKTMLKQIIESKGKCRFWKSTGYNFTYVNGEGKRYVVALHNKQGGGQFGGVFNITLPNSESKRYFCKAYWGYPGKGNFNSEKAFQSTVSYIRTSDIYNDQPVENFYSPLDFKELFIYKALEFLEIGPKFHFFKVPVIKDGFFILTEDLNSTDKHFIEMRRIDWNFEFRINDVLLALRNGDLEKSKYEKFEALVSLLELDTVNRIFKLHDCNDGNYGFIETNSPTTSSASENTLKTQTEYEKTAAQNWLTHRQEFKILDFIAPPDSDSYVIDDIFNDFLDGDSTQYLLGHLMDLAICRSTKKRNTQLKAKHRSEKIFFGRKVIESLENRFSKYGGLKELLDKAKNDIGCLLYQKYEEISDEYYNERMADLKTYIDGIVTNYNNLKKDIMAEKS